MFIDTIENPKVRLWKKSDKRSLEWCSPSTGSIRLTPDEQWIGQSYNKF
jgi:hypothetical protein